MKVQIKSIYIALVFLLPASANSAEWIVVSDSQEKISQIEISSMKQISKNVFKFWFRETFSTVQTESKLSSAPQFDTVKFLYAVDCNENRLAWMRSIYTLDGNVTFSSENSDVKSIQFDDVVPDSVGESYANAACKIAKYNKSEASAKNKK